ncbi:GntR family transcriptional regulator [Lentzea albidocapillata]|uniref:DNA-binding transcriptional regulator YhcF, GntR family n=1 Tax=Lentzea albidocapillata TaxID=40571 RepID=A0A1W2DP03_9PSEU|nr:GntR family transcriptional regulator [Lentzea albidocapillata]SMC98786.1 DNA-binding transcriptional regulator YhcF, GntR family [Lentzea albidocapillata]
MLLTIDLDSDAPIYQQIRDRVVEAVATGTLKAGDPLPSTRQLGVDLGINFHTVSKAYDLLRQEGVIRINRKSGAVVRRDHGSGPPDAGFADAWQARLRTLLAEATTQGLSRDDVLGRSQDVLNGFEGARA